MRVLAWLLILALPALAETVRAPSGQPLELSEAFWDRGDAPPVLRLRFLAPGIGGDRHFADVEGDFMFLCRTEALPRLRGTQGGARIVITLMDRHLAFGEIDPAATQFFEGFRESGGDCVWDGF